MKKEKVSGKLALIEHLSKNGWVQDRFGHWHKVIDDLPHRIKVQSDSARKEIKRSWGWSTFAWAFFFELTEENISQKLLI